MKLKQHVIALLVSAAAAKLVVAASGIEESIRVKAAYGEWSAGQAALWSGGIVIAVALLFDLIALWLIRSPWLSRLNFTARRDARIVASIWVLWPLGFYVLTLLRGQDWSDVIGDHTALLFVPQLFATACFAAYRWVGRATA